MEPTLYSPPAIFSPGHVVNGTYEVVRYLGIGASGVVYQCRHRDLNDYLVAMKVFFSPSLGSSDDFERFKRELLAAYQVGHPNVVRCYDLILSPELIAFTMEYIGGGNLADRIGRDGPMPIDKVVDILTASCSGLEAIHGAGIIHRDLKPANILLTSEGNIKITDFGIARMSNSARVSPRGVLGTVEYVSPEYCSTGQVDPRSDIYSLGVIAYELLSARVPYRGEAPAQTICMKIERDPLSIRQYRRDCPEGLAQIVHKALARNPAQRFQNAHEMHTALRNLQRSIRHDSKLQVTEDSEMSTSVVGRGEISRVKPPRKRTKSTKVPSKAAMKAPRYPRFGGAIGLDERFLQLFAATSIFVWIGTVALWIYSGRYTAFFAEDQHNLQTPYQRESVSFRYPQRPEAPKVKGIDIY